MVDQYETLGELSPLFETACMSYLRSTSNAELRGLHSEDYFKQMNLPSDGGMLTKLALLHLV